MCQALTDCFNRQRRGAEEKLEVAREVSQENARLQEKLHSFRKEVRHLEASRHARSDEVHVLQAQLRSASCYALLSRLVQFILFYDYVLHDCLFIFLSLFILCWVP